MSREHLAPKGGEPALHRAAREGDHEAIRRLVRAGAAIDAAFDMELDPGARPSPATPLMVAAGSGDGATVETVRLLLELGADPKLVLPCGSAAEFACRGLGWNYRPGGDEARLRALLDAGSPLPLEGRRGARISAEVAGSGDPARLRVLLERGASPNAHWVAEAAAEEHGSCLALLRQAKGNPETAPEAVPEGLEALVEPPQAPSSFEIPLFRAAESGSAECVRLLLEAGADIHQRDSMERTALMLAGSPEVVRALVGAGARPADCCSYPGDVLATVLEDHKEDPDRLRLLAAALLEAGAPLEWRNKHGWTRLYQAAWHENLPAVRFLLDAGHPIEPNPDGATALHGLCWHWDHDDPELDRIVIEIIDALVAAGIDVNAQDAEGNTALHECVSGDGANVVAAEHLLRLGADPNLRNRKGHTPLSHLYETHFEYAKMVPPLLIGGADPLIPDREGRTAIDLARARAAGEEPDWRLERFAGEGDPPCGWKDPAEPADEEWQMIQEMEDAARRRPDA
jgi:ankyrin repeat protein